MVSKQSDVRFALVTGASSGIGKAYAKYVGQQNEFALLLVARRGDRLQALKQDIEQHRRERFGDDALPVETMVVDLFDRPALAALIEHVQTDDKSVDMLVNCAGFSTLGAFHGADIDAEVSVVEINCLVPLKLVRAVVPGMVARKSGTIINVSSIGAFQPAPYMAVYAASKSFVLSYTLAIAEELKDTAVRVFAHCPGPTHTEFHLVAGLPEDMSPLPPMTPEESVQEAMQALHKKKGYLVNGFANRWMVRFGRLVSPITSARMAEKVLLSRWKP